jgi:hypothetical protein
VEAAAAPAGGRKLAAWPELVLPEPRDPTALLLWSSSVQALFRRIRTGRANAALVRGNPAALAFFCRKQASARGA